MIEATGNPQRMHPPERGNMKNTKSTSQEIQSLALIIKRGELNPEETKYQIEDLNLHPVTLSRQKAALLEKLKNKLKVESGK